MKLNSTLLCCIDFCDKSGSFTTGRGADVSVRIAPFGHVGFIVINFKLLSHSYDTQVPMGSRKTVGNYFTKQINIHRMRQINFFFLF